jgi:hypothetical protein
VKIRVKIETGARWALGRVVHVAIARAALPRILGGLGAYARARASLPHTFRKCG